MISIIIIWLKYGVNYRLFLKAPLSTMRNAPFHLSEAGQGACFARRRTRRVHNAAV